MASPDVESLDPAALDRFRDELIAANFHSDDGGRTWVGPIAEPLRNFTDADRMTVHIRDGWPFAQPQLQVKNLRNLEHANAEGTICLWEDGDGSRQWVTVAGLNDRIEEWVEAQKAGFTTADATMDAHAYFGDQLGQLASMDLDELGDPSDGDHGSLYGRWRQGRQVLDLNTSQPSGCDVKGRWFYVSRLDAPPTDRARFAAVLTDTQRQAFEALAEAASHKKGGQKVALLVWGTGETRNVLAVLLERDSSKTMGRPGKAQVGEVRVRVGALEFAPSDETTLKLRAGRDVTRLAKYSVVVFGAGAIGSHVALLLAEAGLGSITLIDKDRLRPGNVVRHAAPVQWVGYLKTEAMKAVIGDHAPWTDVTEVREEPWMPSRVRELIKDHDLVIDATGSAGFSEQLARLVAEDEGTLVSATLFRQGDVSRVRRQDPTDTPMWERNDESGHPTIPHDPDAPITLEPGCSSPVNNASPVSVAASAARAAEVALAAMRGTPALPDEIIDVYQPLEEAPFDQIGRLTSA